MSREWAIETGIIENLYQIDREITQTEFSDSDDEQVLLTVVPVTDEAFIFFYNENAQSLQQRFNDWRDKVVAVALKQLEESL